MTHAGRAGSLTIVLLSASCLAVSLDTPSAALIKRVDVYPATAVIQTGDSMQLRVKAWDSAGRAASVVGIQWRVSDTSVARIDSTGLVVGKLPGSVLVTAATAGPAGYASVVVAPAVLVGAGDIAACASSGTAATAALLDAFGGIVFTAGDNVYESGTLDEFAQCYDPTWGRYKTRTRPAPGNHDYLTPGAAGYFSYFGAAAGDPSKGYYSYDLASWHIAVINSSADVTGGSPQEQWLRQDLASHPARCTLAYWHYPRFSSGWQGSHPEMEPIWQALYEAGADVVISGHDHDYERFGPQTPSGSPDSIRGIREFVVGTGGKSLLAFRNNSSNSEVRDNTTFGVLLLKLYDDRYEWEFVPTQSGGFTDAGADMCH